MKMVQINWMRFTTILASRIINNAIIPLDSEDRANVLIIDDSMFERNRSKKVELLAKVYDTQNINIASDLECLLLDGQMGVHFCR